MNTYLNRDGYPPTICIELLKYCNLQCFFCRSNSSPSARGQLRFQDIRRFLLDIANYGKWRISLTGGEPTFWKNLPQLVNLLSELQFPFAVTTNGVLGSSVISQINPEDWKLGILKVSIDGDRSLHDSLRGSGNYDRALDFLMIARSQVPYLSINTVILSEDIRWASDLVAELSDLDINHWTIISPVQNDHWVPKLNPLGSYIHVFNRLKQIANKINPKMKVVYLDFAESQRSGQDVVFISSNGKLLLPLKSTNKEASPQCLANSTISIQDWDVAKIVADSVSDYIKSWGSIR
jgi:MoaA/NifB/PqqE/SkfB family radical SAM enzyme